jgi:signal transduction histidine kinase
MNPALRRLSGYQGDEPQGLRPDQVLDCPEVNEALEAVLKGEELDSEGVGCQITLASQGAPTHLQVTCAPFKDGRGVLLGAMAIFEDVTAWFSLDQLKNEYVSTVAHEIASPLSSVLSQLQTLQRGLAGELNEKQSHLIDRAAARVGGIVKLSKELLDLAKIEAGAMGEKQEINLSELVSEALDIVSAKAEEKDQILKMDLPRDLPTVPGIRPAVLEVFVNLLSNAVRYTPENGEISVTARILENGVETAVADSGFGIPPEDHEKIFERFYRVKDANTRMIVGTGLGLPIVKKVVTEHGGNIRLKSAPGQGSTFYVFFPYAKISD